MTRKIVASETKIGDMEGVVVMESDAEDLSKAYLELRSSDATREALMFAASSGLSSPGMSRNVETYPVDRQGRELEDFGKSASAYRIRGAYHVTRRLV